MFLLSRRNSAGAPRKASSGAIGGQQGQRLAKLADQVGPLHREAVCRPRGRTGGFGTSSDQRLRQGMAVATQLQHATVQA